MHPRSSRPRLGFTLGVLTLLAASVTASAWQGPDDPRSRGSRAGGFAPARRDVFDLLRSLQTPGERKEMLEQRALGGGSATYAHEFSKAARGDVQLSLSERGDLEPAEKVDLTCKVRTPDRDKPSASTIVWVIDNGTAVKKGDLLLKLDDSLLRERLANQGINVAEKKALVTQAELELEAARSEANRLIKVSQSDLKLAEAALKNQATTEELEKRKAAVKIEQAKLLVALAKLKGGVALEVQVAESNVQLAEFESQRIDSDLALARLRQETQVQNAQDAVASAKLKAEQMLNQLRAKREVIFAALKLEETRLVEVQEDLANCQLLAPNDGTVMYHEPTARRGVVSQGVIAAGEPVREGQKLLSIWKPGPMLMRIRVEESLVARLQPGQRTMITIPAIKQSLAGKVQSISPIAAAPEGPATETRYYPVVIAITETSEMLRPSMAAQASIMLDEQKNVMRVPLHAITLKDGVPHCFVKKDDGIHERKVTLGITGSSHIEIKSGLEAGDDVVVSIPRTAPTGFGPGINLPGGGRGPQDR